MSSSLMWCPYKEHKTFLPDELKSILVANDRIDTFILLDSSNIEYFLGLHHAGVEGAIDIIDAIKLHDTIKLELVF